MAMILVQGRSGSAALAQLVPDQESARRFMATLDEVSLNPIAWRTDEVLAMDLLAALEEIRQRSRQE
jgi:hypothetical protein